MFLLFIVSDNNRTKIEPDELVYSRRNFRWCLIFGGVGFKAVCFVDDNVCVPYVSYIKVHGTLDNLKQSSITNFW